MGHRLFYIPFTFNLFTNNRLASLNKKGERASLGVGDYYLKKVNSLRSFNLLYVFTLIYNFFKLIIILIVNKK